MTDSNENHSSQLIKYINGHFVTFVLAILALYGLLCTVYSDIIIQNHNDCFGLPYESIFNSGTEITFEDLIGQEKDKNGNHSKKSNNIYLFALDISASLNNSIGTKSSLYDKYSRLIKEVDKNSDLDIKIEPHPKGIDVAKAYLFSLLKLLEKRDNPVDEYAVWTLGNKGKRFFPEKKRVKISPGSIEKAISEINMIKSAEDLNTDFDSLFYRFSRDYKNELEKNQSSDQEGPFFIITILSDLVHDVENKYKRREEIEKVWISLKERILQICSSRAMINMIIFSSEEWDIRRTIFSIFKNNIEWYRLNKFQADENEGNDLLNTIIVSEKNLRFYYKNPYHISESSFFIQSTSKRKNTIKVEIPMIASPFPIPKFNISLRKLNAIGNPVDSRKRIFSGGSGRAITLNINQLIKFTYSGRPPSDLSFPILKLSLQNEGKTLLIPIDFVKRLPWWAAVFFIILQFLFILSLFVKIKKWRDGK